MTRYSVKRGRRIKKYKKSRKGCRGRGRRSIRRCKSRKSKIFMKTKRNNVSNRRNMVGGVCRGYNFNITVVEVQEYVKINYDVPIFGSLTLVLIGFGIVLVTNADKGRLLKKYNRPEQVAIFKSTVNDKDNIYIARGKYPIDTSTNYIENTLGVLKVDLSTDGCIETFTGQLPENNEIAGKLEALDCRAMPDYLKYKVHDDWGRVDYRICVYTPGIFTPTYKFANEQKITADLPTDISSLFKQLAESENKTKFVIPLRQVKYPVDPIAASAAAAAANAANDDAAHFMREFMQRAPAAADAADAAAAAANAAAAAADKASDFMKKFMQRADADANAAAAAAADELKAAAAAADKLKAAADKASDFMKEFMKHNDDYAAAAAAAAAEA